MADVENPFAKYSKSDNPFAKYSTETPPDMEDKPSALHAAGRSFVESLPSAAAGLAGFGGGMKATATMAAKAATAAPGGPIAKAMVGGAIGLAGGLAGAFTASGGAEWVTEKLHALMDPEDYAKRQQEKKDNPNATMVGSIGANLLGLSPKTAPEIAGKFLTKPLVQRGATGALMGGITAGEQAVKGEFDPKEIAISAATGVVMPGFNAAGKVLVGTGERIISAAFRRKSNGKIIPSDDKHDLEKKTDPDLEQGFLDEKGEFLRRMEAADKARKSGQIPPDKELKDGGSLHTGDLKDPTGKRVDEVPKTREEHKIRIGELDSALQSLMSNHEESLHTKDGEYQKEVEAKIDANLKEQEDLKKSMPLPENREAYKAELDPINKLIDGLNQNSVEAKMRGMDDVIKINDENIAKLQAIKDKLLKTMPEPKVKDKAYPTLDEAKDILWGVKTVGEALDTLYKGGYGSMGAGLLAKLLSKSKFGMEAKFKFSEGELHDPQDSSKKWAGMYDPNTHEVVMSGKVNDVDSMRFMRDILHEAVHATSHALLHDLSNPHGKRIRELFRYVDTNARDKFRKEHAAEGWTEEQLDKEFKKEFYGITNEHEFVSEAFTNPKFQKMLQDMLLPDTWQKVGKKATVWQQFKNAVRKGIEEYTGDKVKGKAHTALDEALDIGSHIIEAPKAESLKAIRDYKTSNVFPAEVISFEEKKLLKEIKDLRKSTKHSFDFTKEEYLRRARSLLSIQNKLIGVSNIPSILQNKFKKFIDTPNLYKTLDNINNFNQEKQRFLLEASNNKNNDYTKQEQNIAKATLDNKLGPKPVGSELKEAAEVIDLGKEREIKRLVNEGHDETFIRKFINVSDKEAKQMLDDANKETDRLDRKNINETIDASPNIPKGLKQDFKNYVEALLTKNEAIKIFNDDEKLANLEHYYIKFKAEAGTKQTLQRQIAENALNKFPKEDPKDPFKDFNEQFKKDLEKLKPKPVGSELKDEDLKKEAAGIDPRSIANEEEFNKHAEQIYATEGKDAAIEFFKAWKQEQKDRAIPVPKNRQELDDALHKIQTWTTKDSSEFARKHKDNTKEGMTPELREKFFRAREGEVKLTPEETVQMQKLLAEGDKEVQALIQKVRKLSGDGRAFREFETGQARYRLFTPRERSWKDFWGSKDNALLENMADDASATRERSVFQLEDGRVVQTYRVGDGSMLYEWKDGKRSRNAIAMSEHGKTFTAGDTAHIDGKDVKITDGQVHNIEKHSPYRYLKDAEATQYMKLMELRKNARDLELMDNLKKNEFFGMGKGPDSPLHEIPKGFRVPNNIDKIPQLRGWMFDSKTAAIIEDFAKTWDSTLWMKLTNQLVKNMMLNPLPHMLNEIAHLWNFRGLSGWVTPKGLSSFAKLGKEAWTDVSTQSQFYRDVMKEGGSVLGADPRNNQYWSQVMKDGGEAVWGKPQVQASIKGMAEKLGFKTMDFYNAWSKNSQKAMWFSRDVMYVQAIKEVMARNERRGTPVTLKEAVAQAERHMPNYRMPSEVLGSRGVAEVLKNPNVSLFSRYHYGMIKSLVETMKEINPKNLSSVKGRGEFKDGLDSVLAIGVAMTVMYPLMDMLAEEVFGKGAKQRRAGPFHMIEAIEDVATGKKDASALVWPIFTFNPMLLTMAQLVYNKQLFSGKPVFHPEDKAGDIASDIGTYLAKQVPQVSTGMKATNEGFGTGALAKQFDVQVQSPQTQAKAKKAIEMRERNKKTRERKRLKGTYTP